MKLSGKEFDMIKAGIVNAFVLESFEFKDKLKDSVERRLYSAEKGYATYFAKSEIAQSFIIRIINENLKLQGVKARGPKVESRPNLHVDFPPAFDKQHPETIIKQLLQMYAKTECEPVVRQITPYAYGRTISVQLPDDKLAQVAIWGIDNDQDYFEWIGEKLRFRTTYKPSIPLKTSVEVKEDTGASEQPAAPMAAEPGALAQPAMLVAAEPGASSQPDTTAAVPSAKGLEPAPVAKSAKASDPDVEMLDLEEVNGPSTVAKEAASSAAPNATPTTTPSSKPKNPEVCPEIEGCPRTRQYFLGKGPKCHYWHFGLDKDKKADSLSSSNLRQRPASPPALSDIEEMEEGEIEELLKDDDDQGKLKTQAQTSPSTSAQSTPSPMPSSRPSRSRRRASPTTPVSRSPRGFRATRGRTPPPFPMPTKSPDQVSDKVLLNVEDAVPKLVLKSVPAVALALAPVLVQEVQAASNREAAGTDLKVERPKRSRAINKFVSENYVLDAESIGTQPPRRSRSLSVTSNRRSEKGSDSTKLPSIKPFLKPNGASTKMGQNEALQEPKVATAKSLQELLIVENEALSKPKVATAKSLRELLIVENEALPKSNVPRSEVKVSQTLMKDFFSTN